MSNFISPATKEKIVEHFEPKDFNAVMDDETKKMIPLVDTNEVYLELVTDWNIDCTVKQVDDFIKEKMLTVFDTAEREIFITQMCDSFKNETTLKDNANFTSDTNMITDFENLIQDVNGDLLKTDDRRIIGYDFIKLEYEEAVRAIAKPIEGNISFTSLTYPLGVKFIEKMKKAGILDLWFKPVYGEEDVIPSNELKVKIKRLNKKATIPSYSKAGDAGMDLTAISKIHEWNEDICYGTGLAMEIPVGYVGLIFPRSSIHKTSLRLVNSVGVIDSGYRGEIKLRFSPISKMIEKESDSELNYKEYEIGDRIGQITILPYPQIKFEEVDELSITDRNDGGFGSTGN